MAKVFDLTESDGDLIVLGRSIVLPSSDTDSLPAPLNGAIRFNPTIGRAQFFFDGAWITLGSGDGSVGGTSNNHTHTIAQIQGLATALAQKASLTHTHNLNDVTGLTTALAAKANVVHGHAIDEISGLTDALAGKASITHSHSYTINEHISACLPGNPPAQFRLVYTSPVACVLPANLIGSFFRVGITPAATFVITMFKNVSTQIGTVSIAPTGTVQISFIAPVNLAAGDTLTFQLPVKDTKIDTISFSIVATRASQATT